DVPDLVLDGVFRPIKVKAQDGSAARIQRTAKPGNQGLKPIENPDSSFRLRGTGFEIQSRDYGIVVFCVILDDRRDSSAGRLQTEPSFTLGKRISVRRGISQEGPL